MKKKKLLKASKTSARVISNTEPLFYKHLTILLRHLIEVHTLALLDKRAKHIYMKQNNINSIVHIHTRWHHMGLDCIASVVSTWTELQETGALRPGHWEDKHSNVTLKRNTL